MLYALALMTPDAAACGGFFCNNLAPVEQAGEAIVFEVDPVANQTTMHVQVEYSGPASEFAWIVPVSDAPDLFVSNDALFSVLDSFTRPTFWLQYEATGECPIWMTDDALANANGVPAPPPVSEEGGVTVVAEQQVGPYDTVVLTATDSGALIDWLQANDYQIPDALEDVLSPYVASRRHFVALRLSSGNDAGDLVPLAMRYPGTQPSIPIQLTSVAATPDMQLVTYVLGAERAVPTNYLHVELNEAAIDWFGGAGNYMDVLSRAADEAGGHAFTTEFAGGTVNLRDRFWQPSWSQLDLASSTGPADFIERITMSGLPASTQLLDLFRAHVPIPDASLELSVYNCPSCYPELDAWVPGFDAAAAAADMEAQILQPLFQIDAMFERNDRLTRLGSTVSPDEMTVDPEFGFNPDMQGDVSNQHTARVVYRCDDDITDPWQAPKELILADGTTILIPSDEWLSANGLTASQYLANLQEPAAARIEQTGTEGQPDVIFDGRPDIDGFIDELNDETERLEGKAACGCDTTPSGALAVGLAGLLPLLARRRRS